MADISQIKLPNNTTYDLKDAKKTGIYPVIGTQTAATGTWIGALHGVSALYDGLTIMYYLPCAGSGNATLNLTLDDGTTTGAVNCYYNTGRLTTHYTKGSNIVMTYWSAGSIKVDGTATTDNRWIANANYADGNSVAYNIYNYYNYFVAGSNKIFPYTIVMQNADGRWESLVTSSSTGTSKARNTHGFRLGQMAFLNANTTYAENAQVGNNQISYHKTDLIDHRYSFNTANNSTSGTTAKKPIYLVGAVNASDGLFYLDSTWWTQTLPSTADGKLYIYLGDAYDYYRMSFVMDHPVYWYRNGMIREFAQDAATVTGHTVGTDVPSNADFSDFKVKQIPTTSTSTTEKIPLLLSAYNDQSLSDDSDPALVCASPNLYYNNANQDLYANKINGLATIPALEIKFRDMGRDPDDPVHHLYEPYHDSMSLEQVYQWQFSHGGIGGCYIYLNIKSTDPIAQNDTNLTPGIYICPYWTIAPGWGMINCVNFTSSMIHHDDAFITNYEGPFNLYHLQFTYNAATKRVKVYNNYFLDVPGNGAKNHRNRFRGKKLGESITDSQYNFIADGSFRDMYIGDYWEITEPASISPENPRTIKFYIADFDPFLGKGSQYNKASNTSKHHIMLIPSRSIPKDPLTLIKPSDCSITVGGTEKGGYYNSVFRQNMSTVNTYLYGMFGEDHILKHEECIQDTKYASTYSFDYADAKNCIYADCTAELLSQNNVFGHRLVENGGNGLRFYLNDGFLDRQVPIFRHLGFDEIIEDTYINSDTGTTRTCLRDNVQNYWVTYYFTKGFAQIQNSAGSLFHPYFLLCKSNI